MNGARTVAGAMGFAAPVAVRRKHNRVGIADAQRRQRRPAPRRSRDRARRRPGRAPPTGDRARLAARGTRGDAVRSSAATMSRRASRSVATSTSSRKPGLPEVLRQNFRVAPSEDRRPMAAPAARRRESDPRSPSRTTRGPRSAASGAPNTRHHHPPRARRLPRGSTGQPTADAKQDEHDRGQRNGGRARHSRWQIRTGERRLQPGRIQRDDGRTGRTCSISSTKPTRYTSRPASSTASGASRRREQHDANRRRRANRPAPAVQSDAAACDRQMPEASQSRAAPSSAASAALPAPTPCPARMSILTPASCSARSTPAWYAPCAPVPVRTRAVRRSGE